MITLCSVSGCAYSQKMQVRHAWYESRVFYSLRIRLRTMCLYKFRTFYTVYLILEPVLEPCYTKGGVQ